MFLNDFRQSEIYNTKCFALLSFIIVVFFFYFIILEKIVLSIIAKNITGHLRLKINKKRKYEK